MVKIEDINKLPTYMKFTILGLVVVIVVGVFFITTYLPKKKEIQSLEGEIAKIENEINVNKTKARRLDELKKENEELERQLALKKRQLPSEAEVESLLKQVSDLGLQVGLDFKLWRPGAKRVNESNLYLEIPVNVNISGDYHLVATFFDRVGRLQRIVNIENIKMASPKLDKNKVLLNTTFTATAFASYEAPKGDNKAKGKKGKVSRKKGRK